MLGSTRIGTVFGIQVRVHWLWPVFVLFLVWMAPKDQQLEMLLMIVALFGIVFLHELGHSLVARRFGIRVLDITLWPLGGMARMSEIPEDAKTEGVIALAGPAVNFVLAFLAAPFFMWAVMSGDEWMVKATGYLVVANLVLGVFNLVPAFPMDGGRVLRAYLGRKGDWVGATETAVRVGKVFAIMMIVAAPLIGFWFLPVIGLFVWFAGSRELMAVRMRHAPSFDTPFGHMFAPFAQAAAQAAAQARTTPSETVHREPDPTADPSGARRPSDGGGAGRRLTDDDIERLERYRGPLRRFGDED